MFVFFLFFSKELSAETPYTHQVSVCAIFREDGRFLKEWIEFHRIVGVEHFWLYNNLSKDNYLQVLSPYIAEGIVELIDWPYESESFNHFLDIQDEAYKDGISRAKGITKWLAFIDTDEFLFPVENTSLSDVLSKFETFGGVCTNWQIYGTSGIKRIPDDRLMLELLTSRAQTNHKKNFFIKTVVRPERVKEFPNPHNPYYLDGYHTVNTNREPMYGHRSKEVVVDQLRINHYWTRDEDFFYEQKVDRWSKPGTHLQYLLRDFDDYNECQDTDILRFADVLRLNMFNPEGVKVPSCSEE
jgi:hypothetical protein